MNATAAADLVEQWASYRINLGLTAQWLSIKGEWEPNLTQALGQTADDCLALLRQELAAQAGHSDTPPDWPALTTRLGRACAQVVSTRSQASKALLLAMVKEVAAETGQILTLNGLAGTAPALHAPGHDPRAACVALAGGPALDEYVKKGFVEFGLAVTMQFKQARAVDLPPQELYRRCLPAASRWRQRLTMLARTMAHEVFNRARIAVSEKLV